MADTKAADENEPITPESEQAASARVAAPKAEPKKRAAAKPKAPKEIPIGASAQNDEFVASVTSHNGIPLLQISRVGWVGPAQLSVHRDLLPQLDDAIAQLKAAK